MVIVLCLIIDALFSIFAIKAFKAGYYGSSFCYAAISFGFTMAIISELQ